MNQILFKKKTAKRQPKILSGVNLIHFLNLVL